MAHHLRAERFTAPLIVGWAALVTAFYWYRAPALPWAEIRGGISSIERPWAALVPHDGAMVKAVAIWIVALLCGRALLMLLGVPRERPVETFALSAGLGLLALSQLFFAFAALSLLHLQIVGPILGSFALLAGYTNRDLLRAAPWRRFWRDVAPPGAVGRGSAIVVALVSCIGLFCALAPEVFYDSLVYHLAVPKLHILEGGLTPMLHNAHEGIPMTVQFFYGVGLLVGDDGVAKMLAVGLVLVCCAALLAVAGRERRDGGWLAAAVVVTTPIVLVKLSLTANDIGLATFTLLALLCVGRVAEGGGRRWAVLAGLMVGAALATKYTVWALLPAVVALLIVMRIRMSAVAIVAGTALVVLMPWVVKNLVFYGNPIFPIYHDTLTSTPLEVVNWQLMHDDAWARDLGRLTTLRGFVEWLFAFFVAAADTDANLYHSFATHNIALLAPLPALFVWKRRAERVVIGVALALLLFWMLSSRVLRLMLPALVLFALLGSVALFAVKAAWARWSVVACLALSAALQVAWGIGTILRETTYVVATGAVDRATFLSTQGPLYPVPSYAAMDWVNRNTPEDSRILVVGDARGFHLERPFIASSAYNRSPLVLWAEAADTPAALAAELERRGITHVLFNPSEAKRTSGRKHFVVSRAALHRLGDLYQLYMARAYHQRHTNLSVYRLKTTPGPRPRTQGKIVLPFYFELVQ